MPKLQCMINNSQMSHSIWSGIFSMCSFLFFLFLLQWNAKWIYPVSNWSLNNFANGLLYRLLCSSSDPAYTSTISEIGYLLLPSRGMIEILLKQCKILNTTQSSHRGKGAKIKWGQNFPAYSILSWKLFGHAWTMDKQNLISHHFSHGDWTVPHLCYK